jgi:Zn-finger nucleic acid-binding protein
MTKETEEKKRRVVHVTSPDTACGYVGHMTVDELTAVATGQDIDVNCPVCGQIHLDREEIEEIENQKLSESAEYQETARRAEAADN